MKDVKEEDAKAFSRNLLSRFTANTHNKYIVLFTHIFQVLERPAQIESNPFELVRKVPSRKMKAQMNSRRELTVEEMRTVISKATGELRTLFVLGMYTGLRLGDCATLRWSEIDLSRQLIIRKPLKTRNTTGIKVKIGIPKPLHRVLEEHEPCLSKRRGFVLADMAVDYQRQKGAALTKIIQEHFCECGIETQRHGTGKMIDPETGKKISTGVRAITEVGFHSLRHTYVSLHAEAGTPQSVIRDLVGHGNVAMTEHYEHISDATVIRCAEHLPSILESAREEVIEANIPEWIRVKLETMTSKNWKDVRVELLTGA